MFDFLRRKKNKIVDGRVEKQILHGHDLSVWAYLGFLELKLNNDPHPTFLFCKKDDHSKRSYSIHGDTGNYVKRHHTYVAKYLETWKNGEKDIYTYVRTPSKWLEDYMLLNYRATWDSSTDWWKTTESSKYDSAKVNQEKKKESESEIKKVDGNVVALSFGKDNVKN